MLHFSKDSIALINIFVILFVHIYCRWILHKRKKMPLHSGKMQKILKFKCSMDILLSFTLITLCWETIHILTVLQYNVQIMHRLECEGLMKITCRGYGTVRTHKGQPCMFWPIFIYLKECIQFHLCMKYACAPSIWIGMKKFEILCIFQSRITVISTINIQ